MKRTLPFFAPLAFVLLVNCGGSPHHDTSSTPATSLVYEDPHPTANEWALVKDAATTTTHLVLNLVGPSNGSKYRGVGFTLQGDPKLVKFARFKDATGKTLGYFKDGGVFLDRNEAGTSDMPVTLQAGGVTGNKLMVGIYQKTDDEFFGAQNGATAKDCSSPVLQVAIDLDPSLQAAPGMVPLSVLKARVIEEHVANILDRKTKDATIRLGTLTLK